jgi:hypothetical protein
MAFGHFYTKIHYNQNATDIGVRHSMRIDTPYSKDYGTCSYTHAWLRIMSEEMDPNEITKILNLTPTQIQHAGEPRSAKSNKVRKTSGWWISTKGLLDSLDARHHLDWILERVSEKTEEIKLLQKREYLVDVCVRWDSKSGHGGPTLSSKQLLGFGKLGIEVWFDIYFDDDEFENA